MFHTGDILTRAANYGIRPDTENWSPGQVPAGHPRLCRDVIDAAFQVSRCLMRSAGSGHMDRVRRRGSSYNGDFWNGVWFGFSWGHGVAYVPILYTCAGHGLQHLPCHLAAIGDNEGFKASCMVYSRTSIVLTGELGLHFKALFLGVLPCF